MSGLNKKQGISTSGGRRTGNWMPGSRHGKLATSWRDTQVGRGFLEAYRKMDSSREDEKGSYELEGYECKLWVPMIRRGCKKNGYILCRWWYGLRKLERKKKISPVMKREKSLSRSRRACSKRKRGSLGGWCGGGVGGWGFCGGGGGGGLGGGWVLGGVVWCGFFGWWGLGLCGGGGGCFVLVWVCWGGWGEGGKGKPKHAQRPLQWP